MKKSVKIISVTGLVLLILLTFISRSVYNKNLPQVTAVTLDSRPVPLSWETVATLCYPNQTDVKSNGTWTIREV
ncbi:MAG: hypothetical protein FWE66_02710, partial [Oscillospiraceae bacterium]|nr:hypothetical protein [Oscillospiraceae bacterium]